MGLTKKVRMEVKQWMKENAKEHEDCAELNYTLLAEDAALVFNLYNECDSPEEELFELAYLVGEEQR